MKHNRLGRRAKRNGIMNGRESCEKRLSPPRGVAVCTVGEFCSAWGYFSFNKV